MAEGKTYVLFDFDGVIADSFAAASALAKRACVHHTADEYRLSFEGNIHDTYDRHHSAKGLVHDECEHAIDWWSEYEKLLNNRPAFNGIADAIRTIARDHQLIIVSSCVERLIRPFLERIGVADCFLDILDADIHTSKTKKIEMIFETYEVGPDACVLITDTLGDIREASYHSIGAIGCSWGFHPRSTLERGVPFRIVDTPAQLPDAVEGYFSR